MGALSDFFQSASNSAASNVSAPIDGISWLLRKAGFDPGPAPIGGSDWMAQKGLTRPVEQSASSLAGETAALLAPFGVAAKAPEIAMAMLQGGENLMAPTTLSKQAGVFIGPSAKTWSAAKATKAQQMADQGVDARAIWPETGTWKGPDGMWRQEVSDHAAKARDYQLTPAKAFSQARVNAAIEDSQPLRDRAESMLPYWQKSKTQLQDEFSTTGSAIVDAALSGDKAKAMQLQKDRSGLSSILEEMASSKYGPASSYLKHGELGKAYPDVYKMHTRIDPDELGSTLGQYMRESPRQGEQIILREKPVFSDAKSTQIHELQHAIQQRENWARGGNQQEFSRVHESGYLADLNDELANLRKQPWTPDVGKQFVAVNEKIKTAMDNPYEAYRRLAGEAEARATQARIQLTPEQRLATFPADSYDVPLDQLIIRKPAASQAVGALSQMGNAVGSTKMKQTAVGG